MKRITFMIILTLLSTSPFTDVSETDWYYDTVNELYELEIISGYLDGTFKPDQEVSVEEFIVMTVKAMGKEISVGNTWSEGYITTAKTYGLVIDTEFRDVRRSITRGEMARIILRAYKEEAPDDFMSYYDVIEDIEELTPYWQNIAMRAFSLEILSGYPDGTIKFDDKATRAEAAMLIKKVNMQYKK